MDSIRERFAKHFFDGDDWTLTHAQVLSVEAFIKEELLALAESIEKRQLLGNVGHIENVFNQGLKDATTIIRTQANLI